MTAEKLREAASGIRAEFAEANDWVTESERSFYLAVADWLDAEAELMPDWATHYGPDALLIAQAPAVRVARAYLNEVTS